MLAKNDLLEKISVALPNEIPDWEEVVERFYDFSWSKRSIRNMPGCLAEVCVRTMLERICAGFGERVVFDSIKDKDFVGEYTFHSWRTGINVASPGETTLQMDMVLLADELPVLVEVKSGSAKHFPKSITLKAIENLTKPINKYFGTERCGYMVIAPLDQIRSDEEIGEIQKGGRFVHSLAIQREFRRRGGLLVPLYADRSQFKEDLQRAEKILKGREQQY